MPKLLKRLAVTLAIVCGALVVTDAVSAQRPARPPQLACNGDDVARAGRLNYLPELDVFVSLRGDIFRVSQCPTLGYRQPVRV